MKCPERCSVSRLLQWGERIRDSNKIPPRFMTKSIGVQMLPTAVTGGPERRDTGHHKASPVTHQTTPTDTGTMLAGQGGWAAHKTILERVPVLACFEFLCVTYEEECHRCNNYRAASMVTVCNRVWRSITETFCTPTPS